VGVEQIGEIAGWIQQKHVRRDPANVLLDSHRVARIGAGFGKTTQCLCADRKRAEFVNARAANKFPLEWKPRIQPIGTGPTQNRAKWLSPTASHRDTELPGIPCQSNAGSHQISGFTSTAEPVSFSASWAWSRTTSTQPGRRSAPTSLCAYRCLSHRGQ
jgi:hypothetical protein